MTNIDTEWPLGLLLRLFEKCNLEYQDDSYDEDIIQAFLYDELVYISKKNEKILKNHYNSISKEDVKTAIEKEIQKSQNYIDNLIEIKNSL